MYNTIFFLFFFKFRISFFALNKNYLRKEKKIKMKNYYNFSRIIINNIAKSVPNKMFKSKQC